MRKMLCVWLTLMSLMVVFVPTQAAPTRQEETGLTIVAGDPISGLLTENVVNAYQESSGEIINFSQEDAVDYAALCSGGEIDIIATTQPLSDECDTMVEIIAATYGATIIISDGVDFLSCITPEEIGMIWGNNSGSPVTRWTQVNSNFPDRIVSAYVPENEDLNAFVTSQLLPEATVRRDTLDLGNDPVRNINSRQSAIGYIPMNEYLRNPKTYHIVPVGDGVNCFEPTPRTLANGEYKAATRIFWYALPGTDNAATIQKLLEFLYSPDGTAVLRQNGGWSVPNDIAALSIDTFILGWTHVRVSGASGASFEIRLSWASRHDLDLAMRIPDGTEIGFFQVAGHGYFRVAENGQEYCGRAAVQPNESIFALEGVAITAAYVVSVQQSLNCNDTSETATFTLELVVDGEVAESVTGEVGPDPEVFTHVFNFTAE